MIDPRRLSLEQWADAVNLTLATAAPPMRASSSNWKLWAYSVVAVPSVAKFSPPDPGTFVDWLPWAERFVECVFI